MVIRSWRDAKPHVGHENKIIWSIFRSKGIEDLEENEACLLGLSGLTVHRLQPAATGTTTITRTRSRSTTSPRAGRR